MTDELDLRLSAAFRSLDIPAAPPRLVETLDDLRVAGPRGAAPAQRHAPLVPLAAAASLVVATALLVGQLLGPSFGPPASPTPTARPSIEPTPSPGSTSWTGYSVATLIAARAAGELAGEQVILTGWWTDLRPDTTCGTQTPSPLIPACGDGQFGLTENEAFIGTWQGDEFVPGLGPALTPYLSPDLATPGLGRSLIGLRDENGDPHPPVFVTVLGRFDSPLADACPEAFRQACRDRFVIDQIVSAEVPAPLATRDPDATAPAGDDEPPASWPGLVDECRLPRTPELEPGDPEELKIVSREWVRFESLDVQPRSIAMMQANAPAWVYVAITEPDVPLTPWTPDPDGSAREYRYVGQAVCIGWEGMTGMFHSTVPGTTYQLWSDGERVPVEEFPPRP